MKKMSKERFVEQFLKDQASDISMKLTPWQKKDERRKIIKYSRNKNKTEQEKS